MQILGDKKTNPPVGPRTLVVLGCPRGGTSAIAGLLHHSGVTTGPDLGNQYEDPGFKHYPRDRKIIGKRKALAKRIEVARSRSAQHEVWGFKDPNTVYFLDKIRPHLPSPRLVVVTRDPLEISQSSARHDKKEWDLRLLRVAVDHTQRVYTCLRRHADLPAIILSLEWLKRHQADAFEALESFTGCSIDYDRCQDFLSRGTYRAPTSVA